MELDDLKTTWQTLNTRVDHVETAVAQPNRKRRLQAGPIAELVVASLAVIWAGGFLWDNAGKIAATPLGVIPAFALYPLAIFTIWLSIRQLMMIAQLDYSRPVVETQQKIAALKRLRVRSTQIIMLISLPLWVLLPLLAGQAIFGFMFVRSVSPLWIGANLLFGLAASAALVMAARTLGDRPGFWQKLNDALAGTEILRAERMLAEVNEFASA